MAPWIAITAAVVFLTLCMGLGASLVSALGRRKAPRALAQVREALARRRPDEARRLLPYAFWVPASGRWRREDAKVALAAVIAFDETMGTYRLATAAITRDLRSALERCALAGTPVPWRLVGPFVSVLWAVAPADAALPKIIRQATVRAALQDSQSGDGLIPTGFPPELAPVGAGEVRATAAITGKRPARDVRDDPF